MDFAYFIPITLFVCIVVAIKVIVDARVRRRIAETNPSEEAMKAMIAADEVSRKLSALKWGLVLTIALGMVFLGFQIYEYAHAYADLNLKLTMGAYGATFFMLTGFHGFHVTMGAIMLAVVWFRCLKGHFTPTHHFAFEGVAWYWHFVDVVWLGLFVFVYWL